jgi:hypothetical protein
VTFWGHLLFFIIFNYFFNKFLKATWAWGFFYEKRKRHNLQSNLIQECVGGEV